MAYANFAATVLAASEELDRREDALRLRRLRDSSNPFDLSEDRFVRKFRLTRDCTKYMCDTLRPTLQRQRKHGLSVESQVLTALRFFSRGSYQQDVGENYLISVSQPSVSRAVTAVADAVYSLMLHEWVRFPETVEKREFIKKRFLDERNFKGVLGCIDCTHVAIFRPSRNEQAFLNHHGFHSLNVQVVASQDLEIVSINARYPGSVHDSFIWKHSTVRQRMIELWDSGIHNSWLLGDSGYPLEPWLMTPIPHAPEGTPEYNYTKAHCSTRNCVERLFGVMKNTFRCLMRQRTLHYSPITAGKIILALAVIHNMRRHSNTLEELADDSDSDDDEADEPAPASPSPSAEADEAAVPGDRLAEGRRVRAKIIRENYTF